MPGDEQLKFTVLNCSSPCDNCACAFSVNSLFLLKIHTFDRSVKPPGRGEPRCGLSGFVACPGFSQRWISHMPEYSVRGLLISKGSTALQKGEDECEDLGCG